MDDYEYTIECARKVLRTPEGRTLVWEILNACSLYEYSSLPNPNDVYHRLGRQSVGVELLNLMEQVDKDLYAKLMLEHGETEDE